jgi:CRISPR system Cascade subunit CasE
MSQGLYLMHLRPNINRLLPWAQRQGLVPDRGQGDLGYAFHAALRAGFGDLAPQPFSYRANQGLLAYTREAEGVRLAGGIATPEVAEILGIDATSHSPGLLIRPFPKSWNVGQWLSFEVRVRPVVRKGHKELDAFLSAAQHKPNDFLSREEVYAQWLKRQFEPAADLDEILMTEFSLSTVIRRTVSNSEEGRLKRHIQGPQAVFTGVLKVRDSIEFAKLIERGIGRHRAFGFGMLLLKPASAVRG